MLTRKVLTPERRNKFRRIFGYPPPWDNITGFDMLSFEEFIKPREDESIADAVERLYGSEGVGIVQLLMSV